jgi:peptide/nickel transport system ATP-binding protein/oligopeptide transport system ATP-binding protein
MLIDKKEDVLSVKNLCMSFHTDRGILPAVSDVSIKIKKGQILGFVGESGCGKSMTALSIMQLIPVPPGKIDSGEIFFHGKDLLKATEKQMEKIRGKEVAMIFQEPMTSLNPVIPVGKQIREVIKVHEKLSRTEISKRALEMIKKVGIPMPEKIFRSCPHQLSGGMRQRIMIAMALACRPELLICDEPTTALDVTIQAQILKLILDLRDEMGTSVLLITHDMGVISEVAEMVVVMYAGQVMEYASTRELFTHPLHPYTLVACKH